MLLITFVKGYDKVTVKKYDLLVCGAALGFYLLNKDILISIIDGPAGWFLLCYANDIFAGAAIVAWLDLLLRLGKLPPVHSWRQTVPFLLVCGFVWEFAAPLFRFGATFDPWDFAAYQIGGLLWLAGKYQF